MASIFFILQLHDTFWRSRVVDPALRIGDCLVFVRCGPKALTNSLLSMKGDIDRQAQMEWACDHLCLRKLVRRARYICPEHTLHQAQVADDTASLHWNQSEVGCGSMCHSNR